MPAQEKWEYLPPRQWIKSRPMAHILTGVVGSAAVTSLALLLSFFEKNYFISFLVERGPFQPVMLAVFITLISFSTTRKSRIKKELSNTRKNWLFQRGEIKKPEMALTETISVLMARKDILANRQLRILRLLQDSNDRNITRGMQDEDSALTGDEISQAYYIPKTLIWALPMIGFLGTVTGISSSVAGFSGLLENASNVELIKTSLQSVMGGLSTAFDTTIMGIICALLGTLALSLTERAEFGLAQEVDTHINDRLFIRIQSDGTFE